jgi:probable HAF family extracellular repeat protein
MALADRGEFGGLGLPPGMMGTGATAVSADGSVITGNADGSPGVPSVAFRWTRASGMSLLGTVPGIGPCNYYGLGISGDGGTIVGYYAGVTPNEAGGWFQWTAGGGAQAIITPFGQGSAYAASFNGSVIVGTGNPNGCGSNASVWTAQTGIMPLENFGGPYGPGDSCGYGAALGVSADGSAVVGWSVPQSNGNNPQAFRWTQQSGMQGLGYLPGGGVRNNGVWPTGSIATAISADGQVIVGWGDSANSGNNFEAFRWTQAGGIQGLGDLPGGVFGSRAFGVSGDGSVVVGSGNWGDPTEAFIWTPNAGMRTLRTVLTTDYRLNLSGWTLSFALAVSADGRTVVGEGLNPCGQHEAWVAYLGSERACPADFNGNGVLSVADVFAYLNEWFAGAAETDVDGVCSLSVADIFYFLNLWFAGCP